MNIKSAIIDGASILKRKFISSANLDSEILMAKTLQTDRHFILLNSHNNINKNDFCNKMFNHIKNYNFYN